MSVADQDDAAHPERRRRPDELGQRSQAEPSSLAATTPPRSRGSRLARAAALCALALLTVELALVVVFHVAGKGRGMELHPDYGWRMRPSIARSGDMWGGERPARTNSAGWRDRERAREAAPEVVRAAVVGDSFTFGVGADDGERFTDVLDGRREDLEVLNFGVNGFGTDQELCVLREEALGYDPEIVVCASYLGNDLKDIVHSFRHRWPKPHFRLVDGALVHHPPQPSVAIRMRSACYLGEAAAVVLDRLGQGTPAVREPIEDPEALYLALIAEMRRRCEERGARFLVMLVHDPTIDGAVKARVAAALAAAGTATLDLTPAFEAAAGAQHFNPPPVAHWNAAGHAVVADALERDLGARGWIEAR